MKDIVHATDWVPFIWFPFAEWRSVTYGYGDNRFWCIERRFRKRDKEPALPEINTADLEAIVQRPFDWLRDYGPLWEPGTKAFWLEPETEAERQAWDYRYTIAPKMMQNAYNPYANAVHQYSAMQNSIMQGLRNVPHKSNPYYDETVHGYLSPYKMFGR